MTSLKKQVYSGVLWQILERFINKIIAFIVSIVLARLLSPTDFGLVAMLSVFIVVSNTFVDSGFGTALIQKKEVSEVDYNSIFYLSLGISSLLYAVLFFCAPFIADFYNRPLLVSVLRWSALSLIISAVNGVQSAVLQRNMQFNLSFRISLVGTITHGIVGLTLAWLGYGVWALVFATLGGALLATIVRWHLIGWCPKLMFAWQSVKQLFGFGSNLLVGNIINRIFLNLNSLVIGKVYTPADLGYYNRGYSLPESGIDALIVALFNVTLPAFSKLQHDLKELRNMMRRAIKSISFLVVPAMIGMAVCAPGIVLVLLGDKWLPSIPYIRFACLAFVLHPFTIVNEGAILALGRSDFHLKISVLKRFIGVIILFSSIKHGVLVFACVGALVGAPLGIIINAWPNRKLLGYSLFMQLQDVLPSFWLALGMSVPVLLLSRLNLPPWLVLSLQLIVGVVSYFGLALLFKVEALQYVLANARNASPVFNRICLTCRI